MVDCGSGLDSGAAFLLGRVDREREIMAHFKWDIIVGIQRAHIVLPEELVKEIDSLVGPRGRSAFLVETARAELRRRRLLSFLRDEKPAWPEKDHPEIESNVSLWVSRLRKESEKRIRRTGRAGKRSSK